MLIASPKFLVWRTHALSVLVVMLQKANELDFILEQRVHFDGDSQRLKVAVFVNTDDLPLIVDQLGFRVLEVVVNDLIMNHCDRRGH